MTTETEQAQPRRAAPVYVSGFCDPARRRLVLISAILASAMGFIDGSVVSIAIPAMRETLGASLSQAQWISNAYMLTLAALILVGGAMGDRFGLARIFSGGIALFVSASIACALAPSAEFLIWARAAQGLGAAFMVPGSLAIIARTYPREERGRAIGIWAGASALTTALGPIVGGLALTFGGPETWRLIYAVNLPFGLCAILLLRRAVVQDEGRPNHPVDLPGSVLAVLGLGLLAWGLTSLEHGPTPAVLTTLVLASVTLAAFIWVEARSAHPMLPLNLFADPAFSAANALTFTLYFGLSAMLFFLPMTVITAWGVSEIEAAASFAPLSVFISLLSARVGKWSDTFGAGRMIALGSLIVAIGYVSLALTFPAQEFWGRVFPSMCVVGFGMAFVVGPLSTAIMANTPDEDSGTASGVNNAVSRVSGLVAVAIIGPVLAALYTKSGGTIGFGLPGEAPAHVLSSQVAFVAVVWVTAALSLVSSLIAWRFVR